MVSCIILAGGIGERLGNITPKQFIQVHDRPIFTYCIETFQAMKEIDHIIIVTLDSWVTYVQEWVERLQYTKVSHITLQGSSRQHSIYNGLNAAAELLSDTDYILIHDSVRPFVNPFVVRECIRISEKDQAAIPVLPLSDALYLSEGKNHVFQTISSKDLCLGQTPVCVRFGLYYRLHQDATDEDLSASKGSLSLLFNEGLRVGTVLGDPDTFKITTKEDLEYFIQRLERL